MTQRRWGATALLVLALTAGSCSSDDSGTDAPGPAGSGTGSEASEPSVSVDPVADEAAAAYLTSLKSYHRKVARAASRAASATRADSASGWRAAERLFVTALEAAPQLEGVDGGVDVSESYARTAQVAGHVQGFVDEHAWMTGWDRAESARVNSVLFTMSSEQYAENLRVGSAYERAMSGPGDTAIKMKRALPVELTTELQNAAEVRRKVETIGGKDSFTPSLRDHLLNEIDVAVALGERYLEYVETVPAGTIKRDLFRNGFSDGNTLPGESVSNAPALRTVSARKLMAEGLSELVEAADGGPGRLPLAGDIYRDLILRLFEPPSFARSGSDSQIAVDEQLYWLWRIREIEDTPVESFDNARLTMKLQLQTQGTSAALINVDSRFDELAALFAVLVEIIRAGPASMAANKPWIIELLDRPFPDALDDVVAPAQAAAALLSDDGSPASPELMAVGPGLLKALKRAADDLDDATVFRKDFRAAIDGTRPPATP